MNECNFLLHRLGFSVYSLQNGFSVQMIEDAALKIGQLTAEKDKTLLLNITKKLLPLIEDDKFSPIWVTILDKLPNLSHQEDGRAIYSTINEKQAHIFTKGSLPKKVLYHLWLTYLPSLECAVLTLVEHVRSYQHLPVVTLIQDAFIKSYLAETAGQDCLLYNMIFRMLISLTSSSGYAELLVEIIATFCHLVRNLAPHQSLKNQVWTSCSPSPAVSQLEAVLRSNPDPETMSASSTLNILQLLYEKWMNMKQGTSTSFQIGQSSSCSTAEVAQNQHFEDLWCLTIEFRNWVFAALRNIFTCDLQYTKPCLWYLSSHQRVPLCAQKLQDLEVDFLKLISGLRNLLHSPLQSSELASLVLSLAAETYLILETKTPSYKGPIEIQEHILDSCRSIVNLLLMKFLFLSDNGVTIAEDITVHVTGSEDPSDHVLCMIYHHHLLGDSPKQWNLIKREQFLSFIKELDLKLDNQHRIKELASFLNIKHDLKSLMQRLK